MPLGTAFANLRRIRGLRGVLVHVVPGIMAHPALNARPILTASVAKPKRRAHPTQSPRPGAMRWKIAYAMLVTQGTQARARSAW